MKSDNEITKKLRIPNNMHVTGITIAQAGKWAHNVEFTLGASTEALYDIASGQLKDPVKFAKDVLDQIRRGLEDKNEENPADNITIVSL